MYSLLAVPLVLAISNAQYIVTTSVDSAGNTYWSPTAGAPKTSVRALPSVPTLTYNCAIVPALCLNVAQLRPGAENGGHNEVFGWDPDKMRKIRRREKACPSNWKKKTICPASNQPPIHPLGITSEVPPHVDAEDFAVLRKTVNGNEERTGIMMSCDEFPPAMAIQGGIGIKGAPRNGVTYCAPISFMCSKIQGVDAEFGQIEGVASEQNWQGTAHKFLSGVVGSTTTDIWIYRLQTVVLPPQDEVAIFVSYSPQGAAQTVRKFDGGKRDMTTSAAAVFGISNTGAQFHLEIPHGHTTEEVMRLREESNPGSNHTLAKKLRFDRIFDGFEIRQNIRTARRVLKSGKLGLQDQRFDISTTKQRQTEAFVLQNTTSTVQDSVIAHGPAQRDPRVDPPVPILQIGLEYTLQDSYYTTSNNSRLPKRQALKKSCGAGSPCADNSCCNSDGQCGYGPNYCSPTAPVTCLSNCDATAMCGRYSLNGSQKCGLNLCCSFYGWCGTTDVHCVNSDPLHQTTPCQAGFGSCQVFQAPSCGGTTSGGRKIAYYQSWNVRQRKCQRISPRQIRTDGLTHLYFAFAAINPTSFAVQPLNPADPDLYSDFTSLKTDTLKTWIAIGGFDFSNSDATTHTTWSDMVATQANRASFIQSLISFMDKYGFQGADFDWEYPAAEARGGKPEDTQNLVQLMKETRAAFGTKYGLSIILAPDYWYLRGMDPKEMEQYVDWFGFMAYDLHGAWDADVKTIGALVRPQTDLREITNNTLPLWFDKLDPAKVNLGLAYYGRGFTLTDKSCNYMGCSFNGPSKSGPCTNSPGVMSNREIMQLIKKNNLTPTLIREAQVKQITWEDQWMGYDDDETIAAKIRTANSLCLGGTMIWSIDFDSGSGSGNVPDKGFGTEVTGPSSGGGNNPGSGSSGNSGGGSSGNGVGSGVVYVDGTVWTDPQPLVACEPPCVLILPPIQLPSSTVITFPALTTTYVTKRIPGDAAGQGALPTLLTVTTVIAIPPVTTTEIEVWAVTVFPSDPTDATFTPVQSVMPPSIVATFPGPPRTRQTAVGASTVDTKSHDQIFYPQPTFSVDLPPMVEISYTRGAPKPSCTTHCGHHDCQIFGCGGGCSLFGCGGNCGLLGCGGGCGLFACGGACGILGCGGCGLAGCGSACQGCGANIVTTASDTSSGEDVNPEDDNDDEDDDEDDDEIEACLLEEADLANGFSPADDGINEVEDVASVPADTTSTRAPTSTRRTTTVAPSTTTTVAASPTITTTTVAPKPPAPAPSPQAICYFDQGSTPLWFYTIRLMLGAWVQDGGIKLWREIRGCELVGRWNWAEDENDGKGAKVEFYAGSWMKKGCVGRAIRSAGGPKVSC